MNWEVSQKVMTGRGKIRKVADTVIIMCLLVIAVFSGIKLYHLIREYRDNQQAYKNISEAAITSDDSLNVDFDELRKINPDVVGWIRYKCANIDYPIVKGRDNSKYLYTKIDGAYSDFGTLFVDAATEVPFEQFNTIVYGHHMHDGSMFGSLKKLRDPKFCRKHPRMEFATPAGNYDLEICAFLNQPSDSVVFTNNVNTEKDRSAYIEWIRENAEYTTVTDITVDDRLVILSTCAYEYSGARYIVVCKMMPPFR